MQYRHSLYAYPKGETLQAGFQKAVDRVNRELFTRLLYSYSESGVECIISYRKSSGEEGALQELENA